MLAEHRSQLLSPLARLDQLEPQAGQILAAPVYPDVGELAEELRELLVDMRAKGRGTFGRWLIQPY